MKEIIKRETIISLIKNINNNTAYKILSYLQNKTDEQGKNPPIIALEEGLYNEFLYMIKEIPYIDEYIFKTFKIFFDPFNLGIFKNTSPLSWNVEIDKKEIVDGNYEGFCNTKTEFYSLYSPYAYITQIQDEQIRNTLIEACHTIDYELIENIPVKNIPVKDEYQDCHLYEEHDYVRYVPIPLHNIIRNLKEKNINVESWSLKENGIASITINFIKLSKENQNILTDLLNSNQKVLTLHEEFGYITISTKANEYEPSFVIEERLNVIVNQFIKQQPNNFSISINELYELTVNYLRMNGVKLSHRASKEEKIEVCTKSNKHLVLNDRQTAFYFHPSLKSEEPKKKSKI